MSFRLGVWECFDLLVSRVDYLAKKSVVVFVGYLIESVGFNCDICLAIL